MLSSNMLLLILILEIGVTFSTPTPVYAIYVRGREHSEILRCLSHWRYRGMRMRNKPLSTVVFLIFSLTPSLLYGQRPFIKTRLCEALNHPARFDGKMVEFRAKYSGTFEGTWITDTECSATGELLLPADHDLARRYGVEDAVTKLLARYTIDDVIRDHSWEEFDFSRRHLYGGQTLPSTDCNDYVTADFAGVLLIRRNFKIKNGFGSGWGHLGGSRFLLVLGSVSSVLPHACAGRPSDVPPPITGDSH
jgi:hypothetical protein